MSDVLAIIPAKRHSSRLPDKNLLPLGGLPLFVWTVQAARQVQPAMTVMVSTDEGPDGDEIAKLAVHEGAIVIRRPPELCRDPAQAPDVALHALERYREQRGKYPDTVVMLLPTSPFRTSRHIEEAIALHDGVNRENIVSVSNGSWLRDKLHVYDRRALRMASVSSDSYWLTQSPQAWGRLEHSTDLRVLNGAVWTARADRLLADKMIQPHGALPYVMDEESGLDIDSPLDYEVAKAIVARRYQTVAA